MDVHIHLHISVVCKQTNKGSDTMNALGHLERMLLTGEITEDEYKQKKAVYVYTILELYIKDFITEEEMKEKLNQ